MDEGKTQRDPQTRGERREERAEGICLQGGVIGVYKCTSVCRYKPRVVFLSNEYSKRVLKQNKSNPIVVRALRERVKRIQTWTTAYVAGV